MKKQVFKSLLFSLQINKIKLLFIFLPLTLQAQSPPVTDHHIHFFSQELADDIRAQGYAMTIPDSMVTDINFILKINLVDHLFLVSGGYAYSRSPSIKKKKELIRRVKKENDLLAEYAQQFPNRISGFYGLNPLESFSFKEMKRCHEELNLRGLKMHFHGSRVSMRNPKHIKKITKFFEYAAANNIPILLHFKNSLKDFGAGDAQLFIENILDQIPPVQLIFAHMGGDGGFTQQTKAVLASFADYFDSSSQSKKHQIYFELSGIVVYKNMGYPGKAPYEDLVSLIRRIGLEKVLFGSDYPVMPSSMYKKLLEEYLPLERKEFDQIFRNNPLLGKKE